MGLSLSRGASRHFGRPLHSILLFDPIPDQFTLIVVAEKKTYSCNVVWRKGHRIGVAFC
jgi:hypothetical protein